MSRPARMIISVIFLVVVSVLYPSILSSPATSADLAATTAASDTKTSIMPLGDSITGTTGCWREKLWAELHDAGHEDIDFVGHRDGPDCGDEYDSDNAGVSGVEIADLVNSGKLVDWLVENPPDVVLMHFGSNDIREGYTIDQIIEGYSKAVDQMRMVNPDVTILVAQLIPMSKAPMNETCQWCPSKGDELNEAIPGWAGEVTTERSPVEVVDLSDGFKVDGDTYDGLHSDGSGGKKIAKAWFEVLDELLLSPPRHRWRRAWPV